MLHIGNKNINLAVKNAGVLYVGTRKMGPIINEESSSDSFVTQSGDTIVTSAGTPLAIDGISSLTTAPSITDAQLTFADDGNSTVSFSMQQLKDYVSPAPAKQGRFVAASAAKFAYSDDGLTWTEVENGNSNVTDMCAGENGFICFPTTGYLYKYSTDGINWTEGTLPYTGGWVHAYGNGKYVAVLKNNPYFIHSIDGINWTTGTLPVSAYWNVMNYIDNKFIVIGYGKYCYSTDGINWTSGTLPNIGELSSLIHTNGKYIAFANSSTNILYSDDGINWNSGDYTPFRVYTASASEKLFVAGWKDGLIAYSSNGLDWVPLSRQSTYPPNYIGSTYGNNKFVLIGTGNWGAGTNIYNYSSDGIAWYSGTLPSSQNWQSIAYGEV